MENYCLQVTECDLYGGVKINELLKFRPVFLEKSDTIRRDRKGAWVFDGIPKVKDILLLNKINTTVLLLHISKFLRTATLEESHLREVLSICPKILNKVLKLIDKSFTAAEMMGLYNVLVSMYEVFAVFTPKFLVKLNYCPDFGELIHLFDEISDKCTRPESSNRPSVKLITIVVIWLAGMMKIAKKIVLNNSKSTNNPVVLPDINQINYDDFMKNRHMKYIGDDDVYTLFLKPSIEFYDNRRLAVIKEFTMRLDFLPTHFQHVKGEKKRNENELQNQKRYHEKYFPHREFMQLESYSEIDLHLEQFRSSFESFRTNFWRERKKRDSEGLIVSFEDTETHYLLAIINNFVRKMTSMLGIDAQFTEVEFQTKLRQLENISNSFKFSEIIDAKNLYILTDTFKRFKYALHTASTEFGCRNLPANSLVLFRIFIHISTTGNKEVNKEDLWYEPNMQLEIWINNLYDIKSTRHILLLKIDKWYQLVKKITSVVNYVKKQNEGECPTCLEEIVLEEGCLLLCGHLLCSECLNRIENQEHPTKCPMCRSVFHEYTRLKNFTSIQIDLEKEDLSGDQLCFRF